jgi:hypothetical protein
MTTFPKLKIGLILGPLLAWTFRLHWGPGGLTEAVCGRSSSPDRNVRP